MSSVLDLARPDIRALAPYQHAFWVASVVAALGMLAASMVRSTPRGPTGT